MSAYPNDVVRQMFQIPIFQSSRNDLVLMEHIDRLPQLKLDPVAQTTYLLLLPHNFLPDNKVLSHYYYCKILVQPHFNAYY